MSYVTSRCWVGRLNGHYAGSVLNKPVAIIQDRPPGVFHTTYFYNHAHRLRVEKPLWTIIPTVELYCTAQVGLSGSSSGYFKPLLDPGGGFSSKTAVTWPFQY